MTRLHISARRPSPGQPQRPRRSQRKQQRQEGMVMLVVLMLILVATSTGVWAMQSTVYEQKASTSFLEASLTRTGAECSAMAGIALEEVTGQTAELSAAQLTKYYLPAVAGTSPVYTTAFATPNSGFNCGADVSMRPLPWQPRDFRVHERITYLDDFSSVNKNSGTQGGQQNALVVISGYGELAVGNDQLDSNGIRGVHEAISISRAYFDTHD